MDDDAVELLAAGPDVCLNVTRRGPVALFNAAQASAFPESGTGSPVGDPASADGEGFGNPWHEQLTR